MASRRMGKEPKSSSGGPPPKKDKQHRGTTTLNLSLRNNGVGINLFSLNPCTLVGIRILILWTS